ncbi:tetratricopeptide repeat protein [Vampirovibrio chlorellavorus]|uniref:tetratricopeptide repeat protein n=1 Tax=Vampirovibrio chlorellavorus TaxID=758823 RepID=UPI0026EDE4E1|nr:tetratricopeptide repeat protein [Vampirovibrio chlorellavorus]
MLISGVGLSALTLLPAYGESALDKAAQLLQDGRATSAAAIYKEYLKVHPKDLNAQLAMANIAIRQFDYPKAKSVLEQALAQHPDSAETAATLGHLFQLWQNAPNGKLADNTRDYQALAEEHFKQALGLNPESPLVLSYAAEWSLQKNDLITAEQNLQKALRIRPTFIPAFQGLARFYMKVRDIPRARDTILHATELDPLDAMNYFLTAQLLATANRPAEAVKYAAKSEQLDYGRLPARDYLLATQYEKLGETPNALQYYETLTRYTPRDAQVWLKLGELYELTQQNQQSLTAFQKALTLKPDILSSLYEEARQNTRLEKIEVACKQWRRLLNIRGSDPATVEEGLSALASLHYLNYFYRPNQPDADTENDLRRVEEALAQNPDQPNRQLDRLKLLIARQGTLSEDRRQDLLVMSKVNDDAVAGEAAFLVGELKTAHERLEGVDGLSEAEYARLADRLLLVQELQFSKVFYQRASQLNSAAGYQMALKRIQSKQSLAAQKADEGTLAFNEKNYEEASLKYQEAARIYQQWDNIYLKLGDTYEKLKKWPEAKAAYDKATQLSPGLMSSQGFAKNYARIEKKAR